MKDYELLVKKYNIGIYNSCEVTELVIIESDKFYNLYTLCVFQEKDVTHEKHKYNKCIYNKIKIDSERSIGIFQYELELTEIKENYEKLVNEHIWISNHQDESSICYEDLRKLNKQFIPYVDKNRLNHVLKNNFYAGSYILEFFDEKKQFEFLTADEEKFEKISKKIYKHLPIDLFKIRDRLGNFIFQFPVNILNVETSVASDSWDSLAFNITWHPLIKDDYPDCTLEVDSVLDNNYIGSNFEEYDGKNLQVVHVGNVDSLVNEKIWRKNPKLLLHSSSGHYIKSFDFFTSISNQKGRYFMNGDEKVHINLYSKDIESSTENQQYYQYIENSLGIREKELLEKELSFKQYTPNQDESGGLSDLRKLITENGRNGVYLWDPYITFDGIIDTLFYCPFKDVELKALGSINKKVRKVYSDEDISNTEWINKQKNFFMNLESNLEGLDFEFRVQKGKSAHDRFLIFPGNSNSYVQPKVYSLGTSINSFGKNYHILQKVSYPQAVIREFNKIWDESEKQENIVWKYPK